MPLPLPDVRLPDGVRRTELAQGESELGGRSKPTAAATDGASERERLGRGGGASPAVRFGRGAGRACTEEEGGGRGTRCARRT